MNIRLILIMLILNFSKSYSHQLYFKFPFNTVTELTCKINNFEENLKSEIVFNFTYQNEVWRKTGYKYNNHWKSLHYFVRFENENFELYNHKRAKIQTGNISKNEKPKSVVKITNNSNEIIGYIEYHFNSQGFVLSSNLTYLNASIDKEIKSISNEFLYNCNNQLIYFTCDYTYFENSHKYKRRPNIFYQLIYCNPDNQYNFKDVYYYDFEFKNILIHEKRAFKYS